MPDATCGMFASHALLTCSKLGCPTESWKGDDCWSLLPFDHLLALRDRWAVWQVSNPISPTAKDQYHRGASHLALSEQLLALVLGADPDLLLESQELQAFLLLVL